MDYNIIPNTNLRISSLGLGTWVFGGQGWGGADGKTCREACDYAIDHSINFIDTAPIYGHGQAESIVGEAIRKKRSKVILATKCGLVNRAGRIVHDLSPSSIRRELHASLRRLNVEFIDLYQCHWPDPQTPVAETMKALNALKQDGKIRHIGVSNFPVDLLEEACHHGAIATTQNHYSLLNRSMEKDILPFGQSHQIAGIAYGVLGGGILTGKYDQAPELKSSDVRQFFYTFYKKDPFKRIQKLLKEVNTVGRPLNQAAINWVRQKKGIACALVGCRSIQQVEDNIKAVQWKLSDEETQMMDKLFNSNHG